MGKYIIKRLIACVFTIFVVATVVFFLVRLMPGDPFNTDKMTPEIKQNLDAKYGLDKPLSEQYVMFMKNMLHGDFGESMTYVGQDVTHDIILQYFPTSAKLGIVSIVFSIFVGLCLGMLAAIKQGKWQDKICGIIATIGICVPSFVVGSILIYFLGVKFAVLPITGLGSWKNYIMPVIALSGASIAFITRIVRSKFIEVRQSDYVRTARAKGLGIFTVNVKHALRNSIIPVITYMGPLVAGVLTGSFVVETMFGIPGLGSEFVTSITNRDYTTVMGVTVFYCTFLIICNFVVDILYLVVDPRIKLDNSASN